MSVPVNIIIFCLIFIFVFLEKSERANIRVNILKVKLLSKFKYVVLKFRINMNAYDL